MPRPIIPIPESPEPPYPIHVSRTAIVPGFGRGSTDLGFPTANVGIESNESLKKLDTGVYFGWARVSIPDETGEMYKEKRIDGKSKVEVTYGLKLEECELNTIYPMVMSLGWNPFFHNKRKSCEVYIIHEFQEKFYGANLEFVVCGYIRPQLNYEGIEALKKDIGIDVQIGLDNLAKEGYKSCKSLLV